MKRIAILGSTGSIGRSTLSVVETYPELFQVVALAAGHNVDTAFEQARRWKPKLISMATAVDAEILRSRLQTSGMKGVEVVHGQGGTVRVATHPDVDFVVSAIVGVAGLEGYIRSSKAGKTVGLANKECLVAAGELITAEARRQRKPLLPIDSEHNAVHQCLRGGRMEEVERIWLTASGGPFLYTPKSQFSSITVTQALNHPTWKMGQRITIDSATLMNKGFEVIEACRLFNLPPSRVQVMVHPQSTIHSMVEFVDGSILAQFSVTDMRLPDPLRADLSRSHSVGYAFPGHGLTTPRISATGYGKIPLSGFGLRSGRSRGGENGCTQCRRRSGSGSLSAGPYCFRPYS